MRKSIFKLSVIGLSLLFIIGAVMLNGETDEPDLRGENTITVVQLA